MIETPVVAAVPHPKIAALPPRPNLGPEPWSRQPPSPGVVAGWGITLLALSIAALIVSRSRRRRRLSSPPIPAKSADGTAPENALEAVAWTDRLRALLVARFDPTWSAKTTEELLCAPELIAFLDPERLERLSALLLSADLVKFASIADPVSSQDRRAALEELEQILKLN